MEQTIDIEAFIRAYKRRWWLIALIFVVITPLVAVVAYSLPPIYQASAKILVESQQIPSELAQTTVTAGVEERISLIRQRLTTRQNLLELSERFDVFAGQPEMSPSQIVEAMRDATTIRGVSVGGRRGPVTSIDISYEDDDPRVAARVANELLTLLLEQNVRQRNEQAIGTTAFFDREVEQLNAELSALETEIAAFKNANQNSLPDSLESRRSELLSLQERMFERDLQRVDLTKRRDVLRAALEDGDFSIAEGALSPEEIELRRLNESLVQARSVYTESHPRLRSLISRIAVLEDVVASAPETAEDGAPSSRDPAAEVRLALSEVEAQIAQIDERRVADEARVAELQTSIDRTPDVELRLNALQRRYGNLQAQYGQAVSKRSQAEIGERLEVTQQAERFEVIEQAQTPSAPIAPNRKLIVAAGAAGALALGFGLVTLFELLNRTIRSAKELERAFDARPFATIPYIPTGRETAMRRWSLRAAMAGAVVVAPLVVFAVDHYVAPLPVLLERALDKAGVSLPGL